MVRPPVDRERVLRTLTFWLRPAFILRVLNRFQRIAGFDRAVALASTALTALIPLTILAGAVLSDSGGKSTADRLIERYDLTGGGAEAVRDIFSPPAGTETTMTFFGVLLLIAAVLSFTRGMQRLFEQTWELKSLSVRNTFNGLLWIGGLVVYTVVTGFVHELVDTTRIGLAAATLMAPISVAFLVWSGWVLTAKRLPPRSLLPFGVVGACAVAAGSVAIAVYVPHLFSSYASRYGVIGAVFAMISALFIEMIAIVASAAAGREVYEELERIRAGERPPDDEVRREWDAIIAEARIRWDTIRRRRGSATRP